MDTRKILFDERPKRMATLNVDINGRLSRWKKGEVVKVLNVSGVGFMIEKLKLTRTSLPAATQCIGIPRTAFTFNELARPTNKFANTETKRKATVPPTGRSAKSPEGPGRDGNKPLMRNRRVKTLPSPTGITGGTTF